MRLRQTSIDDVHLELLMTIDLQTQWSEIGCAAARATNSDDRYFHTGSLFLVREALRRIEQMLDPKD